MPAPVNPRDLTKFVLTPDDLARVLRCHKSTIYRLLKRGEIPAFKIGTEYRVRVDDVRAIIERRDSWSSSGERGRPRANRSR